jgi:1A family penicillin-binding protein
MCRACYGLAVGSLGHRHGREPEANSRRDATVDQVNMAHSPSGGDIPPTLKEQALAEAGGFALRAGALAVSSIAGIMAVMLVASMLIGPALRNASGSVAVGLALPEDATLPQLSQRSVVYAADGSVLAVLHDEVDRRVIPIDEIPDYVQQAVLTAEDRKFYEHDGYDVEGIGRAMVANARARGIAQGGSTITQQLAKQNLVGDEQSFERKFSELLHAMALEDRFTKKELLERYLNQVYFGAGAYGVAAASEEYFRTNVRRLEPHQAALLAAVIRSPGALNPRTNPEGVERRRNQVLRDMGAMGFLSPEVVAEAQAQPLGVVEPRERDVTEPYFVEAVKREFFENGAFGETRQERIELLFNGGLAIHTTLDPKLQEIAGDVVRSEFPGSEGRTAAIASVDPRNGRVVALHSGADFGEEKFDLATQGRRQPGSAFKPFVLAAALEEGFPLRMTLQGTGPLEIDEQGMPEPWVVNNFQNASYGRLDLRQALVRSANTAFAQLIMVVGLEKVVEVASRLGVDAERGIGTDIGPAIALGGLEFGATPLEMASAYGVFANDGRRVEPHVIDRVEDTAGREVYRSEAAPTRVLESPVNTAMVDIMQDVVRSGTATRARLSGWSPAGKTGTTQNAADAWFVGYVPVLSTAVWVGHPEGQVPMYGMTGGSTPARLWQSFMSRALEGVEPVPFPSGEGDLTAVADGEPVTVPDVRQMSETEALAALGEHRLVGQGQSVASGARQGTVIWQSPGSGATARPGDTVYLGVSSGNPAPPPRRARGGGGGGGGGSSGGGSPSGGSTETDSGDSNGGTGEAGNGGDSGGDSGGGGAESPGNSGSAPGGGGENGGGGGEGE